MLTFNYLEHYISLQYRRSWLLTAPFSLFFCELPHILGKGNGVLLIVISLLD